MKNFMAKLGRLLDCWADIETQFITLFTIVMGAIIMVDVVFRNLGMQGISWVEEFGRFMLVATTLLGCSIAVRSNGHMLMDVLYTVLPVRVSYVLKSIAYAVCCAMYLYIGYYSYGWMMKQRLIGKTMQSCQFPAWIMWIFVVYGFATMGLRYGVQVIKCILAVIHHKDTFTDLKTKEM